MNWEQRFSGRTKEMRRTAVRELLKLTARPGIISFAGGLPAAGLFPVAEIRRAADAVLARQGGQALQYGETEGVGELRDWIARRHSVGGLRLGRDHVLIVSGAQQALDLIGRVLLDDGDAVVVENPTYLALLSAWRPLGVRFLAAPSDGCGMRAEDLAPVLRERPKLVYTVPNFQNPQGTTLSLERRLRLLDVLEGQETGLVEDNPYGELRYEGIALPHLLELEAARSGEAACPGGAGAASGHDGAMRVIHVGTFSKVLAPGLRVGWVIAAPAVIEKLVQAKQAADLHTSTLNQWIAFELAQDGFLDWHVPRLRAAYRERRDAMLSALERHFPADATWTRPEGGMFLMVTLPGRPRTTELLERAIRAGVAFVPGEDFHLDGGGAHTLRLNFSNADPEAIEEGIRRLAAALDEAVQTGSGSEDRRSRRTGKNSSATMNPTHPGAPQRQGCSR